MGVLIEGEGRLLEGDIYWMLHNIQAHEKC